MTRWNVEVASQCAVLYGSAGQQHGRSVAVLNDRPAQQLVLATVAQSLFSNAALLHAQTDDIMVMLSGLLLQEPELASTHYPHFAAAVAGRPNNHNLLMQLLQSGPVAADATARGLLVGAVAAALPVSSTACQQQLAGQQLDHPWDMCNRLCYVGIATL